MPPLALTLADEMAPMAPPISAATLRVAEAAGGRHLRRALTGRRLLLCASSPAHVPELDRDARFDRPASCGTKRSK